MLAASQLPSTAMTKTLMILAELAVINWALILTAAMVKSKMWKPSGMLAALGKPCVYVGMTGLDPDLRFDKHKAGIQSNRFVFDYGLRLLPALYAVYNPMPYEAAREMEVELAIGLREAGYGVWQA